MIAECVANCETPNPASEILDMGWEERKPMYREVGGVSAVIADPMTFVPMQLRTVWGKVLLGTVIAVIAPPSFWDRWPSALFKVLRVCASN